jgi:hypothetical protein
VRERVEASIKEVEVGATSIEREAGERMLKIEAESIASLAFVCREVNELTWRVAFLKGELEDVCQAQDTTEVNFQG